MSLPPVRIAAIGSYIPHARQSNAERLADFDMPERFLEDKLGFFRLAVKAPSEQPSDLCVRALEDLRDQQPFNLADIALATVVTQNPDQKIPHTAAKLHDKLGLAKGC